MQLIEAPRIDKGIHPISIFLAGGITKCADWQKDIATKLLRFDVTIFNPRRRVMPKGVFEAERQIIWEHDRIRRTKIVAFWFAPETVNPITLFELGAALSRKECQTLVVACSPEYERRFDVITQCRLQNQPVFIGFEQFAQELKEKIDLML